MSHVKHRITAEQRLAVRTIWACTRKETHSAEFIAVVFDLSRPTVLDLCAAVPRLGGKFTDPEILRPLWAADRQRKGLPTDDMAWRRAVAESQSYIGQRLAESSDACIALIQREIAA
jgi:hypothetical protein